MRVEKIKYPMGALTAEGALIYDENVSGRRPAVLVAPNWMGMTEKAIERGELIAASRYVVFIADMYGVGTRPVDFAEAAALANRCVRTRVSSAGASRQHSRPCWITPKRAG